MFASALVTPLVRLLFIAGVFAFIIRFILRGVPTTGTALKCCRFIASS